MSFTCDKCNKSFKKTEGLLYHIENKVCDKKENKCWLCGNVFKSRQSMNRHIRESCKIKKQQNNERERIYVELLELRKENETLKKALAVKKCKRTKIKCSKKITTNIKNATINTNSNNAINNVINNTIVLIGYGKEDLTKIARNDLIEVFRCGYKAAIKMTDTVHFNPKYPEFHNVYISNIKDKYAMVYDGANWKLTTKNAVVDKLYDNNKSFVEENLEDFCASLTKSQSLSLERWINTDENDEKIKDIKEQLKLLLYNKREIPMQTKEIMVNDPAIS